MGSNKKARVVLQFNEMDFRHRRALEILRQRPRSMSELVVSAILHYSAIRAEWEFLTKTLGVDIVVLDTPILDTTQYKDLLGSVITDIVSLCSLSEHSSRSIPSLRHRQRALPLHT